MSEFKVNNPIDTDPDPSPKPGARRLRHYWTRGAGAAKIRWNTSGDFLRCVRHLRKYVSDPKGLCNVYHRAATGHAPGKHAGDKSFSFVPSSEPFFLEANGTREVSTFWFPDGSVDGKVVPLTTELARDIASFDVDASTDGFQVVGVYTKSNSTEMIEVKAIRNVSFDFYIEGSVGKSSSIDNSASLAVTVYPNSAIPDPTTLKIDGIVTKDINSRISSGSFIDLSSVMFLTKAFPESSRDTLFIVDNASFIHDPIIPQVEEKRNFSSNEREKLGKQGHAFRNSKGEWSYPIANAGDLANAIKAFGRSAPEDRERLKKYIQRRARELGKTDMVPDGWHKKSLEDEITLIETLSYAETLLKLDVSEFTKIFADYDDEEETKDDMQDLEHKNISVSSSGVTETTEDGIVEALVSVTGIVDNVGDIIKPGAYEKTLKSRKAKGVWSHDWNTPVSRVEEIKELLPGDERLPKTLANGEPWPAEAGALYVKAKFNLETQRGREAFSDVKFFDEDTEWSIGYKVAKNGAEKDDKTGIRTITELDLYEFSPVLFGAASNARSLVGAAKSLFDSEEDFINEIKDVIGKDIEITEKKCETCDHDGDSVEEISSEEVTEGIKVDDVDTEARSQEELLPITAESLSQIKALHDQLGEVLALLTGAETKDNKSLRGAMDALIDGAFDSGVVQDIDDEIIALEGAIKSMDSASMQQHANEALDQIQYALQDDRATDQDITDLKNLAEAIGKAIETYQSTEPEEVIDESVPVEEEEAPKKVTMTDVEWKAFLADI